MGTLRVILKQDIPNLGEEGDVKIVKRGYARNYLFPRNLVVDYSKNNRKVLESQKEKLEKKKLIKKENAKQLKEKLEQVNLSITVSAGEKGRLFGTITSSNISEKLKELEYNIDKKSIELKEHIKFGGKYKYKIHLYQDVYADMELEVITKIEKPKSSQKSFKRHHKRYSPHNKSNKPFKDEVEVELKKENKKEVKEKKDEKKEMQNEVKQAKKIYPTN